MDHPLQLMWLGLESPTPSLGFLTHSWAGTCSWGHVVTRCFLLLVLSPSSSLLFVFWATLGSLRRGKTY